MKALDDLCLLGSGMISDPWFQNVGSNLLTILIIAAVGWGIHRITRRARLLRFFGLKQERRLVLYLSNVRVVTGGAIGIDEKPRSYSGTAIPDNEVGLIPVFQRLFNFIIPGVTEQPGFLKWLLISDVQVQAMPSPVDVDEVEKTSTFIAVGSQAYNGASLRIEQAFDPLARLEDKGIKLRDVPDIEDTRCGFVQRVFDQDSGQSAFYVAGPSTLATTGAAYYLARRWLYLSRKYKTSKRFCVVLRFPSPDPRSFEVVFEKAGN